MAVPVLSGATLVLDASIGVTADSSNRISSILDRTANCNAFTQGTDTNKPLLTRSDNLENLIQRSEDLTSNWSAVGTVVLSATSFREDTSTGSHYIQNTLSFGSATGINYIFSARIKPVATRAIRFEFFQAATIAHIVVDSTGTQRASFGSPQNISIVSLGGGWYDISYSKVATTTGVAFLLIRTLQEPSLNTSYTGDGATSVEVTRIQVRTSASDAVYLQTTGAQQHRGVNGHRSLRLDGAQQLTSTSITSNIFTAGAKLAYLALRPSLLNAGQSIFRDSPNWWGLYIDTSGSRFRFDNYDTNYDYSYASAIASQTYIVRIRHDSGNTYIATDIGNGFVESAPVASGNTGNLTFGIQIGTTSNSFYGNIVTLQAKNTGTPDTTFETELRASIYGSTSTTSTTNLFFCYPHLPVNATITTSTASTGYSIDNTIAGERHEHYRRNADATSTNVDYDLGSGNNDRPDYFLVARADFIKRGDSSNPALSLRGSVNSGYTATEDLTLTVTDAELCGRYNEDVILETSYVNDYRYWRLNIATTATFTHEVSKIYFGNFFDLGRDPLYLSEYKLLKKDQNERKVKRVYKLIYDGITEAKRQAFTDTILKNADVYPVFIYDKNDIFLEGKKLLHCWITSHKWEVSYYKSKLTLELTEIF
jgi:hypothetical protein